MLVKTSVPASEIKRIIKTSVPSITYGTGFSALNTFRLRSTTTGGVANAMLVRARVDSKSNQSAGEATITGDVTVIPANATMEILGCPLLRYGQQFFIDLGTGTTADNLYYITRLEHTLGPGVFTTNVSLGFAGTGAISSFSSLLEASAAPVKKALEDEEA